MNPEQIKETIQQQVENSQVTVKLDENHANLVVVSESFEGLNAVKRQQLVYSGLSELISSGALHAVNMETFTPAEWDKVAPFRGS